MKLITGTSALAAFIFAASSTYAADIPDVASTYDWTGLYVGAVGSYAGGTDTWPAEPRPKYELENSFFGGAFAGYNHQFDNNVVIGAEIVGQFGKMEETRYPALHYDSIVDIKGRIGYGVDRALFFVSGGYSLANITEDGRSFTMDGYNIGAGIDFAATENLIVGAEVSYRDLAGDCVHNARVDGEVTAFQVRLAYKF